MTNEEFAAISERIDALSRSLNGRIDGISEKMHQEIARVTVQMGEMLSVVKRSLDSQEATTRAVQQIAVDIEKRTRELEQWRAAMDERVPDRLISADTISRNFRDHSKAIETIKMTLVRWGVFFFFGTVAAVLVVEIIARIVINKIFGTAL